MYLRRVYLHSISQECRAAGRRAVIKHTSRRWLHGSPGYGPAGSVGRTVCLCITTLGVNVRFCRDEVCRVQHDRAILVG